MVNHVRGDNARVRAYRRGSRQYVHVHYSDGAAAAVLLIGVSENIELDG
jgi:hypothetical protein